MNKFECGSCHKKWSFEEIVSSLEKYGFVNLTSENDEIIAFNCPDESCFNMVQKQYAPGESKKFHHELDHVSSRYENDGDKFKYFSSLPFSKESSSLLKAFDVEETCYLRGDIESRYILEELILSLEDYYFCLNFDIIPSFSGNVRLLAYRVSDVQRLISLETHNKSRLFPRYLSSRTLYKLVDNLFEQYFPRHRSCLDYSITNRGEEKGQLISPEMFYKILSVPPNMVTPLDINPKKFERYLNSCNDHKRLLQELKPPYLKGELHGHIIKLIEEFIHNYANKFDQHRLCYDSLWNFKDQYLNKLYQEWENSSLPRKKQPDLLPREVANSKCRAVAEIIWKCYPSLGIKEVIERPEMRQAAIKLYRDSQNNSSNERYSDRTVRGWIKNLAPSKEHHSPGRPKKK